MVVVPVMIQDNLEITVVPMMHPDPRVPMVLREAHQVGQLMTHPPEVRETLPVMIPVLGLVELMVMVAVVEVTAILVAVVQVMMITVMKQVVLVVHQAVVEVTIRVQTKMNVIEELELRSQKRFQEEDEEAIIDRLA